MKNIVLTTYIYILLVLRVSQNQCYSVYYK